MSMLIPFDGVGPTNGNSSARIFSLADSYTNLNDKRIGDRA